LTATCINAQSLKEAAEQQKRQQQQAKTQLKLKDLISLSENNDWEYALKFMQAKGWEKMPFEVKREDDGKASNDYQGKLPVTFFAGDALEFADKLPSDYTKMIWGSNFRQAHGLAAADYCYIYVSATEPSAVTFNVPMGDNPYRNSLLSELAANGFKKISENIIETIYRNDTYELEIYRSSHFFFHNYKQVEERRVAEEQLAIETAEQEVQYQNVVQQAETAFYRKQYAAAKQAYTEAATIKPENSVLLSEKIAEIEAEERKEQERIETARRKEQERIEAEKRKEQERIEAERLAGIKRKQDSFRYYLTFDNGDLSNNLTEKKSATIYAYRKKGPFSEDRTFSESKPKFTGNKTGKAIQLKKQEMRGAISRNKNEVFSLNEFCFSFWLKDCKPEAKTPMIVFTYKKYEYPYDKEQRIRLETEGEGIFVFTASSFDNSIIPGTAGKRSWILSEPSFNKSIYASKTVGNKQWHHIAVVVSRDYKDRNTTKRCTFSFYIDSKLVEKVEDAFYIQSQESDKSYQWEVGDSNAGKMTIDNVRIYDWGVTPEEIAAIYEEEKQ
jgi:hypothetical protein